MTGKRETNSPYAMAKLASIGANSLKKNLDIK